MKILFAYGSAGAGHQKVAEALYNYFHQNCPSFELRKIDVLEKTNLFFKNIYRLGYPLLVNHALWLWRIGFFLTNIRGLTPCVIFFTLINVRISTRKFVEFLIQDNPDFIVSTHFLPSQIAAYLKKEGKIKSRLITVITDFDVHPFWVNSGTDIYMVASSFTKEQLLLQGVEQKNVREFGIPVDHKFLEQYSKKTLCQKFKLDETQFTLLIMTGSFGIGPIAEIVALLKGKAQILVVCANNKKLYAQLMAKKYSDVRLFGFIDNIQELMSLADIIITKPGGSTIAETLAMELVPVFISAIPGQETGNIKALESYGIGEVARKPEDVARIVSEYRLHPEKLNLIKANIRALKKLYSAGELCDEICKSSGRSSC